MSGREITRSPISAGNCPGETEHRRIVMRCREQKTNHASRSADRARSEPSTMPDESEPIGQAP